MADETPVTDSPTAATPSASETATPPAASEVSTSTPETPTASATEAAPAVAPESPAPITETKPTEAATAPAAKEPTSLLGDAAEPAPAPTADAKPTDAKPGDKPAEAKDGEAKPEGEAPETEAPPVEAPLPTYDVFTVPEGVELEDQQVDQFVGTLGTLERKLLAERDPAKIHSAVQEFGQQLLDQYTEEAASLSDRVRQVNSETFARTQENWKSEFFNDPVIGGNRRETTMANVGAVVRRFGGTPQQVAELRSVYSTTGAGNHRLVLNLFNNIAEFLGERGAVPGQKPEPQNGSRKERRYGKGN